MNIKNDIKDITLSKIGYRNIAWAANEMPVLNNIRKVFSLEKPLNNVKIAACLHVTTETANLMIALKEAGARRALMLPVGGAFHSPLMEPAREELAAAIENTHFSKPSCPVYQNVSTFAVTDPEEIKKNLIFQLTAPVKWTQSVQNMIKDGADYFIEVGPGNVLQGLVKKIDRSQMTEKAEI